MFCQNTSFVFYKYFPEYDSFTGSFTDMIGMLERSKE